MLKPKKETKGYVRESTKDLNYFHQYHFTQVLEKFENIQCGDSKSFWSNFLIHITFNSKNVKKKTIIHIIVGL